MKKHNFSAGPSILPKTVFEIASQAVLDHEGSGLSILEISHRSSQFVNVLDEAVELVRELLHLPDGYKVLFLTGGASSQFFMAPANLLPADGNAAYIDTGSWSSKAIKEAQLYGNVSVPASSKDMNYNYIPKEWETDKTETYLHLTSNNTIYGTQYRNWPDTDVPIVCDMSSDIFSRSIPVEKFGLIYAGAQKNMGPAGTTLVIVREDMLGKVRREIPTMLDYRTHIRKNSSFNTPPVYAIYISMLVLRWLKSRGGVSSIEKTNERKAAKLYREIDRNELFKPNIPDPVDRSHMNATFTGNDEQTEKRFLEFVSSHGCVGLKGHRSVGGMRASLYNALPEESVDYLIELMQEFERKA